MHPFPVVRVGRIAEREARPAWLVESLWAEQAVGFIAGTPKSCKTWLALELAVAVASGRPCMGRFRVHQRGHVLLVAAEDTPGAVRHRVECIARARGVDLRRLGVGLIDAPALRLDQEGDRRRLEATVAHIRPRMLILDPLVRLHRADENSAADISALLAFLRQLQREHAVAIALVHHVRKSPAGQPGQALRGSGDLHAWADSNLFLLRRKDRLQLHAEHRSHPTPDPIPVELDPTLHLKVSEGPSPQPPPDTDPSLVNRLLWTLIAQPCSRAELRQHLHIRNETLGRILAELEVDGRITRKNGLLVATPPPPSTATKAGPSRRPTSR
ncbi:MAG TPA: AAA family ATPase [Oceanithermus profundus]|uniref:AAA family ATPase n=1 Tax=Oceanithermus profundus TaxID=187137 RepID=A0A7C4Z982_9DEIN|nr:AAA family ATPase [Oceanithermus profundus]